MELSYYISEIRQALSEDYKNIDDRMITRLINEYRAVFIKNEYNKNTMIDKNLAQDIVVELEVADQSTVDYISTTDRILVSKQTIPGVLKVSNRELVLSIRNAKILSEKYNYVTLDQAIYSGNGKFNQKDIFVFIDNNKLYVKLKKENPKTSMLTFMSIKALFENPLDCKPFQYTDYLADWDYPYPLTDYTWGYIKSDL